MSMLGARRAGNPPILDAVEVYVQDEALRKKPKKKKVQTVIDVCRGLPLKRCLAAASKIAALVSYPSSSLERFPPVDAPFDDTYATVDMVDDPSSLCQAALLVVERTCLTTKSDRAWCRAASTLVRVSAQFDAARSSAFIDQARLDRLVKATDGSQDDSRADAVAKLGWVIIPVPSLVGAHAHTSGESTRSGESEKSRLCARERRSVV